MQLPPAWLLAFQSRLIIIYLHRPVSYDSTLPGLGFAEGSSSVINWAGVLSKRHPLYNRIFQNAFYALNLLTYLTTFINQDKVQKLIQCR